MTSISGDKLKCVFTGLSTDKASTYASAISSKMGSALGNKCAWAAFLGNVGTETGGLKMWVQNPCNAATAAPYCGRGPLQITGSSNYQFCAGQAVCGCSGIHSNPAQASDDVKIGVGTAACVWETLSGHSLSHDATGSPEGFRKTCCLINAGHYPCSVLNGWDDRQKWWHAANKCLGVSVMDDEFDNSTVV